MAETGERGEPLLRLAGVSRQYGEREALQSLDLEVFPGACTALFGHNGSGKSTLLRIACGRDLPTTGSALFDGRPVDEDDPEVRARVAVAGDTVAFYPDLTVREHLELITVAHGVADADVWLDQVLADRRLTGHADQLPSALSSGQTQALQLAAALVRPRDLLVLDEPEQRLDPAARTRLAELLRGEKADGVAVLLATHQAELVHAVADHVVVLEDGKVIAEGGPEVLAELDAATASGGTDGAAGPAASGDSR
ncbi:ABC transporter ATP-binding protein [Streptomyces sp. CA-250714]|uniref:ABC transporter ATP-binding protein n=1 Tax=Streptomyces sp. CA-250714 TaxID=3240060 RepID=UPI003D945E14